MPVREHVKDFLVVAAVLGAMVLCCVGVAFLPANP